jgi:hypothetical protein
MIEGVCGMIGSKADKPGAWWAALSAYAAGVTGTLANFVLLLGRYLARA